MGLTVLKFGGTSVGSPERMRAAAREIAAARTRGHEPVVVVSAMGDTTDRLLALAATVAPGAPTRGRELDLLLATGEQQAAALLALALADMGVRAIAFTGAQAELLTDGHHGDARIRLVRARRVRRALADGCVPVIAGFQGVSGSDDVTTLGRGGSDTTAVALAAALGAERCDIYTDVDGVYSADPRVVARAHRHDHLTHRDALLLTLAGAAVLHPRAAALALTHRVPLRIISSLRAASEDGVAGAGTFIDGASSVETPRILGVAAARDVVRLVVDGISGDTGAVAHVLGTLAAAHIAVDSLDESRTSDGAWRLSALLRADDAAELERAVRERVNGARVRCDDPIARVTIVGTGLAAFGGPIGDALRRVTDAGIEVHEVRITELGLVLHVAPERADETVRLVHDALLGARPRRSRVRAGAGLSTPLALTGGGSAACRK